MATTKTSGNPPVTEGELEDWLRETIGRIDGSINAIDKRLDHLDEYIHRIDNSLQPLRDHPEAVAKGLSLLDPGAMTRKFITGRKTGKKV
jgi:hypothetical protein